MLELSPFGPGDIYIEKVIAAFRPLGGDDWLLQWTVHGDIDRLRIPPRTLPGREDGLWRHTCFEAFIAPDDASGDYIEINASPSLAWASYRFSGYRTGQREASDASLSDLLMRRNASRLLLHATLTCRLGPGTHIGLAAVLETHGGEPGYWALTHPADRPDFHRRESFVFQLQE